MVLTPVKPKMAEDLRNYLRCLPRDAFADLGPATHFARFVVIWTKGPQLLFSSRFDGVPTDYLSQLASKRQASDIWRHCKRPIPNGGDWLRKYLLSGEDQIETQYEADAFWEYQPLTVRSINEALRLRNHILAFARRSDSLPPIELAHEFRQLEAVRNLLIRS